MLYHCPPQIAFVSLLQLLTRTEQLSLAMTFRAAATMQLIHPNIMRSWRANIRYLLPFWFCSIFPPVKFA